MSAPEEEKTNTNPDEEETTKPVKLDRVFLTLFLGSLCALVLLLISSTGGKWVAHPKPSTYTTRTDYSLWKKCDCYDNWDNQCSDTQRLHKTNMAFSTAANICMFLAVSFQAIVFSGYASEKHGALKGASLGLGALAFIGLIITVGIFGSIFSTSRCGVKPKDSGKLSWCFALRCAECVLWIVSLILFAMSGKSRNWHRAALIFAVFVFSMSVITTTARGWWITEAGTFATGPVMGLWQTCTCTVANDFTCKWATRKFRVMQAFSVLAMLFQYALIVLITCKVPRFVLTINAWTTAAFIAIVWGTFTGWYNTSACGTEPIPERTFDLHFNYALSIICFIVQFVNAVVASTATAKLF